VRSPRPSGLHPFLQPPFVMCPKKVFGCGREKGRGREKKKMNKKIKVGKRKNNKIKVKNSI